jgi:fructose 1,6-bisphosphate aldolase/phosphatase
VLTLSIIKADTGGWVGHSAVHPDMIEAARKELQGRVGDLLIDGHVSWCGDDLSLIMTHEHGPEAENVHQFAWDTFLMTTDIAKRLGLYGAGQDLLSDAFSGNLRGMGPGYAEIEIEERPSEPVLCFLGDKTEPGAWNMPLYKMFADPFNTAGLVIDPKMHDGFLFEVHDLQEDRRILFDCPSEIYSLLLFIGAPARYVIKRVISKALGEVAAVTSTQRLSLMAGRYVGKDDPVFIVRCQSGLPAVGEVLEPFSFPHTVAGAMRGSHHAPLMPVPLEFPSGPVRRAAPGGVPRVPDQGRGARSIPGHVRRPLVRPGPGAGQRGHGLPPSPRSVRAAPAGPRRDGVHDDAGGGRAAEGPVGADRRIGADHHRRGHRQGQRGRRRVATLGSWSAVPAGRPAKSG